MTGRTLAEFADENTVGLTRFAYLLCGDRGLAEDLVQDAFVALYRRFGESLPIAAPVAYARRSIVNAHISHRRRRASLRAGARRNRRTSRSPRHDSSDQDAMWRALAVLAGTAARGAGAALLPRSRRRRHRRRARAAGPAPSAASPHAPSPRCAPLPPSPRRTRDDHSYRRRPRAPAALRPSAAQAATGVDGPGLDGRLDSAHRSGAGSPRSSPRHSSSAAGRRLSGACTRSRSTPPAAARPDFTSFDVVGYPVTSRLHLRRRAQRHGAHAARSELRRRGRLRCIRRADTSTPGLHAPAARDRVSGHRGYAGIGAATSCTTARTAPAARRSTGSSPRTSWAVAQQMGGSQRASRPPPSVLAVARASPADHASWP